MIFTNKNHRGFTLIESLIGSAVFILIAISAYRAYGVLMDAISLSRAKFAATAIANEKLEIIRNLTYADVGIIAGLPSGKIAKNQSVIQGDYIFSITNTIRNVDDPFDGTIGGSPADTSPADYKLVDLDISCTNCKYFRPLKFTTLLAPPGLETASSNGALFVRVFDSNGVAIPGASVHIVNADTNPDTIIDETTDNQGWVKIVDAITGTNSYNINATKAGYSSEQTYPIGGLAGDTPSKPDSTVVASVVTQVSLVIDQLSSITTTTVDASCAAMPNINYSLTGNKLIGAGVLKYPTHTLATDASGTDTTSNLEWDTYQILLNEASYDFAGASVLPNFSLLPNENKNVKLVAVPHLNRALLVSVKDATNIPIDGATVQLEKTGFNQSKTTSTEGECATPGQVFWNGLASGTYTLTVSKQGFQQSVASFDISANWTHQNITLNP
jgi:type II secretory pathway pseudopilin PulG